MMIKEAIHDLIDGAKNYEFWMTFGMNDMKAKYQRSRLGQWWNTLSVALFVFVIAGLFRDVFGVVSDSYAAYVSVGYVLWMFMQDSISTSTVIFAQAKPFLIQRKWPISTFAYRLVYREILIFLHHIVLLPPIFIWLGLWPGFVNMAYAFLGLAMVIFSGFWVVMIISIIGLRYRDITPIIQSLLRIAFFATPIIWLNRDLGAMGNWIVTLNPFSYFLQLVREPLLGQDFPLQAWLVAIGITVVTIIVTVFAVSKSRERIAFWL